ncbi:MAG: cytidine deaminase [candidate division Zixibacteria bacterium CG_4_9_14_3_um_filter_46_8]|nr:MAG: cytidine deaminase [candidate division Zixibacteria bacterium CG_4_9_14_3_um_filter_46_8]
MAENKRPSWDEYFMNMAELVSQRSTCLRRKVGAVIVKDKRILATGYNGAPSGLPHCLEIGCLREKMNIPSGERHELCRAIHGEQNALVQSASFGVSVRGASIYSTTYPCSLCSKMLINAGIIEIVVRDRYPDKMSAEMLSQANIRVRVFVPDSSNGQTGDESPICKRQGSSQD